MNIELVKDFVHDLESNCGSIGVRIDGLNDLRRLVYQLREDMDTVSIDEKKMDSIQHYFREFHHMVRVIDDLMHYAMKETTENMETLNITREALFNEVVKEEKNE